MKKLFVFSFSILFIMLIAASFPGAPARAQEDDDAPKIGVAGYPDISGSIDVATIYSRLIGVHPDFEKWARYLPEYSTLNPFEQVKFLQDKPKELEDHYQLMTGDQTVVAQFMGEFSPYSVDNEGYIIKNFADDTFFSYQFAGRYYAAIPQGLMDYQFLPVSGPSQADVEKMLALNKRKARMVITLSPAYADKDTQPIDMTGPDGKTHSYTLVSGKVANIAIYSCPRKADCKSLWENGSKEFRDGEKNDLLNLKQ